MNSAQKQQYSSYVYTKTMNIPRIIWINKTWTMKKVHEEIFNFFRP